MQGNIKQTADLPLAQNPFIFSVAGFYANAVATLFFGGQADEDGAILNAYRVSVEFLTCGSA